MSATLIDLSRWWAKERKAVPAIVTRIDKVTYGELDSWADALSEWLINEGLNIGDRVTIIASNSMEWFALSQGVLRAGGLLAPLNPRFTASEMAYMLSRYEPKFIFHDEPRSALARESANALSAVKFHDLDVVNVHRHRKATTGGRDIPPDTKVVIIPTSGSTARPKGVVYSHRSMVNYVTEFMLAEPQTAERAKVILFAPLSTSAGYVVLTQFLAYGGTIYADDAFDPERALSWIVEEKVTVFMGAPVFFERVAASPNFAAADLSSICMTMVGGARVSKQLLDAYLTKGILLRQIYGQTEAGGNSTLNTMAASKTHPEKCGHGLPFTQLAIIDPQGNFCPPNTPGEIVMRSPCQMVGYWRDPEATAKAVVDGWLHSGDLGVIDESGLLTMLDRIKDIIISGGLNISAAEVERVVSEFPGIEEVAAIAAKDEKFGETPLVAVYSAKKIDVPKLIAHCNNHLSDYKVPRYVAVETAPLPRLATGKIAKPALREKYADAHLKLKRVR